MENAFSSVLVGRSIYHTAPLHYLPLILRSGELRSQRKLGYLMARPTARRRDRILSVDQYIHLSLQVETPLLAHKLAQGFPHVVLRFATQNIQDVGWSVLPCSTKAWRSKWQCQPVTDAMEIQRMLRCYDERTRFRGLEILVKDQLLLAEMIEIMTHSGQEAAMVRRFCRKIDQYQNIPVTIRMPNNPDYSASRNIRLFRHLQHP